MPPTQPRSKTILIPWDAHSAAHIDRMKMQRRACGWNEESVDAWAEAQREGRSVMFWIGVVGEEEEGRGKELVGKHVEMFADERVRLVGLGAGVEGEGEDDGGSFIPVGHICLSHPSGFALVENRSLEPETDNSLPQNSAADIATPESTGSRVAQTGAETAKQEGLELTISNFYVSKALQSAGVGREAMDAMERLARETYGARWAVVWTVEGKAQREIGRYEALKHGDTPKVMLQDWYERRGYVVYERIDDKFTETDSTGRVWRAACVGMRRYLKES